MPAAGRVLGEIELAGDLRSEWPATNSSPARERMRSSAWRHARLGRCDGRRLLHSATLPGPRSARQARWPLRPLLAGGRGCPLARRAADVPRLQFLRGLLQRLTAPVYRVGLARRPARLGWRA